MNLFLPTSRKPCRTAKPLSRRDARRRALVVALLAIAGGATASACSYAWRATPVLLNTNAGLLTARHPNFFYELQLALDTKPQRTTPSRYEYGEYWIDNRGPARSARRDVTELRQYLRDLDTGLPESAVDTVVAEYAVARNEISFRAQTRSDDRDRSTPPTTFPDTVVVPQNVPPQFALYLEGYAAYVDGNDTLCQKKLTQLLELPSEQRRFRTVWATYILARSYSRTDAAKANEYFEKTRALAAEGYPDSMALAADSLGWQARNALDSNDPLAALRLYAHQYKAGLIDTPSLQVACSALAYATPETLRTLASDPEMSRVFTAWILARGGEIWDETTRPRPSSKVIERWFDAVSATGAVNPQNVDRLAWAAYLAGRFDLARAWIKLGDPDSAVVLWVSSRLALRDGRIDDAIDLIARASRQFPDAQRLDSPDNPFNDGDRARDRAKGDLAALHLARGKYVESLTLLVDANYSEDAEYVAERVLTADELMDYVDHHPRSQKPVANHRSESSTWDPSLRQLLARRLMRLGRPKAARPYFQPAQQEMLDQFIDHLQKGNDPARSPTDRGTELWAAAKVMINGESLIAPITDLPASRLDDRDRSPNLAQERTRRASADWLITPGPEELRRASVPLENVYRPDDYRYIAGDLAFAAAELLPDNTDQTAEVLHKAGLWFKTKNPVAADRFYKALVRRCPNTKIGQAALKKGWLPK